jgi:hypothetical protein
MKISYEELISAMILEYGQVDPLDLSLIIADMRSKHGIIHIESFCKYSYENLDPYIDVLKNGTIRLKNYYSLDKTINYNNEKILLKDFLNSKISDFVRMYFNRFDYEIIKERKANLYQKTKVTTKANVLLLSDDDEHLYILKDYGFKKINHFKSLIRANEYFKKHPEELENYDIVIFGHFFYGIFLFKTLTSKIEDLRLKHILIDSRYFDENKWLKKPYETEFYDLDTYRRWYTYSDSESEMLDNIVRCEERNHIIDKKKKKFIKIEDTIAEELPLPTKKSDIKILLATNSSVSKFAINKLKNMGLNIEAIEDNNFTLSGKIIKKLGEYDIIIATEMHSRNLINLAKEACEQDKDTGRKINLLLTYASDPCVKIDELGKKFGISTFINYRFSYDFSKITYDGRDCNVRALRENLLFDTRDNDYTVYNKQSDYTRIVSTVESAVCLYNAKLKELGYSEIKNLNLKSMDDYNKEYNSVYAKLIEEQDLKERAVESIDELKELANTYLYYKKKGYRMPLNGLKIYSVSNGIKIDNILSDRILCSIVLSNNNSNSNVRVIGVQTLTKKGNLSGMQMVGIYNGNEYAKNISKPTIQQENAIESVKKKMRLNVKPLIDDVKTYDTSEQYVRSRLYKKQ